MEQVAGTVAAPFDLRIPAAFAVAHAFDAMDDIDSAFVAYARAHALSAERDRLEGRVYDRSLVESRTRRLMELDWDAPLVVQAGEARRMERAEARIMRRLGLPNPWRGAT